MARAGKRMMLVTAAIVLLALALPLVNVNRYRARITQAMSSALGRQVTASSVSLRLLPQPGFVMENVTIADDPAFSSEAMLRAESVVASLRLTSLWRGRLEIAKLSLRYPSLNLVRDHRDRWNLGTLLARGAQTQAAPTGRPQAEARLRFPYVEAEGARINFKLAASKSSFILSDAEFSLWLATENKWEMRLEGRPMRTDLALSDAGTLRVRGSFEKAADAAEIPLNLRVTLEDGQLGQLSKLLYARDRGWRGQLDLDFNLLGKPSGLKVTGGAEVRDFRRYDIATSESFTAVMNCSAHFSLGQRDTPERNLLTDVDCRTPAEGGEVALTGGIGNLFAERFYDLNIVISKYPLARFLAAARHMKRDLPQDIRGSGTLNAAFTLRSSRREGRVVNAWAGEGKTSVTVVESAQLEPALQVPPLEFMLEPPAIPKVRGRSLSPATASEPAVLTVAPIVLPLGAAPARAGIAVSAAGYRLDVAGPVGISRLLQVARTLGLRPLEANLTGTADVRLSVAGAWQGFAAPVIQGTASIRDVVAEVPGVNVPATITSAELELTPQSLAMRRIVLEFRGLKTRLAGSLQVDRKCNENPACLARFQLAADELSPQQLDALLNPAAEKRFWSFFAPSRKSLAWMGRIRAEGRLTVARLTLAGLHATAFSADARLQNGVLRLENAQASMLGGTHRGTWLADFNHSPPVYSGSGSLERAGLAAATSLAGQPGTASGEFTARYQLGFSGWNGGEVARSAAGKVEFMARDGVFSRLSLDGGATPLRFSAWSGSAQVKEGTIHLQPSKVQGSSGILMMSGTATFDRVLDLRLAGAAGRSYSVTGTLERPRVASTGSQQTARTR